MLSLPLLVIDLSSDDAYATMPTIMTYYDALSNDGRIVYDALMEYSEEERIGDLVITIDHMVDSGDMSRVFQAFKMEHPEYFWIYGVDGSYTFNGHDSLTIPIEFIDSVKDATDRSSKIDELQSLVALELSKYDTDDVLRYDIIKSFHDGIVTKCRYDKLAAQTPGYDNAYNILGVLMDGQAVCQGYALTMKYLCDLVGIPCMNIIGDAFDEAGGTPEPHMWNYVMLEDGLWYCLDVTWDDPTSSDGRDILRHDYYLVGSDTVTGGMKFIESHVPNYPEPYSALGSCVPTATSDVPMKLSSVEFNIRPGSEGDVNHIIGESDGAFTLTKSMIDPEDEDNILYKIGKGGNATIIANDVRFTLSYGALEQILSEMKSTSSNAFIFGCESEDVSLKDIFGKDYTKIGFVPYILNGITPVTDLDDVGAGIRVSISIPYELTSGDVEFLLMAWSVDSDGELEATSSTYSDGYVTFSTDEMDEVYVITSNPLGDFSLLVAGGIVIGAVLIVLIILALIIRAIIKH